MIADRAGLTAAAVYHHYGKKHDLMLAVHEATEEQYLGRIRAAVDTAQGFHAKVEALFDLVHETMRTDREMVIFYSVAHDEAQRHEELRPILDDRGFTTVFGELVDLGVKDGVIDKRDASRARGGLAAIAAGLAMLARELGVDAHRTATDGAKLLVSGRLRRPS
jgi:AcrR family transcriptional regulator